jgi:uridine phosphorylase
LEKQKGRPVFNPADFRAYLAGRSGVPESEIAVPEDMIFTYDSRIFRAAIDQTAAKRVEWYIYGDRLYTGTAGNKQTGIVSAMVGASAASMNLEELISYGAKRIYEVGLSGAIDTSLEPGDVVVLRGALSDEGTSRHYYKVGLKFDSSTVLTKKLRASLGKMKLRHTFGYAWSIDAPYRETAEKVARFRRKGAQVVNMESSAIFAVAKYREVEAASVQIVSDVVSEKQWNPAFHGEIVDKRRGEVLEAVLRSISG